ncbi:MAG: hypothetical protein JWO70_2602 [Betaproteobacteria bacterium]|jgi:hypothetical protein|nr:hypothetical protein [Betaproteobacteria bacterium]
MILSARCTYLLPIRRTRIDGAQIAAFTRYFSVLQSAGCEVLIVDGSPGAIFRAHHDAWHCNAHHVAVDPQYRYLNGKVNGVHTGVALSRFEAIILADDDIRYTPDDVHRMCELLEHFEMVRPQNYLSPLPWWARMEAARMLVNRGVLRAGDYPGTCGLRRSAMLRVGHYDGDVLFDNEEIVRHFLVNGASVCHAGDFFILKRPPTFSKWREQRPRQAYEDFVMRAKTLMFMAVLPLAVLIGLSAGEVALGAYTVLMAAASMALAERGRRGVASRFFPRPVTWHAPLWVLERSLSVYWALYWRLRHGGYPFGDKLLSKGTGKAWIGGGRLETSRAARNPSTAGRTQSPHNSHPAM